MNNYVTGAAIRTLREKQHLTQAQLAERISVSDKTVSKWETGRGFPDVSLLEPLAAALRVSVSELLSGEQIENVNRAANMRRSRLYVCPVCGNVLHATGGAMISCCGVTLPPLEAEEADEAHEIAVEDIEHELSACMDELERAVLDNDTESARTFIKRTAAQLAERNRLCKLNKV